MIIATVPKVGSDAARLLGQRDELVRILVRDPQQATAGAEAEVTVRDLEVSSTIDAAMAGTGTHVEEQPRTTETMWEAWL